MNKKNKVFQKYRFQIISLAVILLLTGFKLTAGDENEISEETMNTEDKTLEKATFGAGCFWGIEAAYRQIEGVKSTQVGYLGGTFDNPTYSDVCNDNTGHAEVVEVQFDPSKVSYEMLLNVFWESHDPTTLNRQGPDIGTQYRSAIFYHSREQKEKAELSMEEMDNSGEFKNKIVTEITEASTFFVAEEYHQQYLEKRGLSSCKIK